MKTRPSRRFTSGFTLIELLVVISIIIVLAAMAFGAANMAMMKAKKTEARTIENSIDLAIQAYYSEYSKLPNAGSNTDTIDTTSEEGKKLITILLGKEDNSSSMENPRQIAFLTVKEGKAKKGGIVYDKTGGAGTLQGIFDPWGNPYQIVLDTDYDDEIKDPIKSGQIVRNKKCIIYTLGADKKPNTNDDVKTWEN
jgi:prepilin-type N-terminal cleavage/methylation domain-containing protein